MTGAIPSRVAERAITRVVVDGEHVLSTYSLGSHGYAQIGWQVGDHTETTTVQRAAWVGYTGEQVPDGMTVDHIDSCRVRPCVRREHLRLLTNRENAVRNARGRDWPVDGTICPAGHAEADLIPRSGGGTRCGPCHRRTQNESQRRRRAVAP